MANLTLVVALTVWGCSVSGGDSSYTSAPNESASPSVSSPIDLSRFPGPDTTGPSKGTSLSSYSQDCYLQVPDITLDSKIFKCDVVVRAAGIRITNSKIVGRIVSTEPHASITVEDSIIDGGAQETFPTVSMMNISLKRVEVTGGQHSVQCSSTCTIQDSWLHGQYLPANSAGHVNAFISNGGSNIRIEGNTLYCSVESTSVQGGCTADASLFGDFDAISDIKISGNLFKANSAGAGYCLQAGLAPSKPYPVPTSVVITDNIFERGDNGKCGIYGPVTGFAYMGQGNIWSNNTWVDGEPVTP